jgi:hypothetical protein
MLLAAVAAVALPAATTVSLPLTVSPSTARPSACVYTAHPHTTYLGPDNVIACKNAEGLAGCRARCSADTNCSGFGVYTSGPSKDRCCTKRNNAGAHTWDAGCSYTKEPSAGCPFTPSPPAPAPHPAPPPLPPAPPSAPAEVSVIFSGNSSYPYNKGAMIQPLPGGRLAAACQAGAHEASGDQRILTAISSTNGRTWSDWTAAAPQPPGLNWAQWEPTLFLAPDNSTLWLFYSEGPKSPGPYLLFASTANVSEQSVGEWSKPRVILNVTDYSAKSHKPYKYMYPISRVVISPQDQAWLLPCDWGCGDVPTGAFTVRSTDNGATFTVDDPIPGLPTLGLCPEPAMAVVNSTTMLAVVRSKGPGFTQSWSHDGGHHWSRATASPIDGAASKPALESFRDGSTTKVVLAYNVITRERMALSSSTDGVTWFYFATLDNGTSPLVPSETSDAYPTVVAAGQELLTTWSTYGSGGGSGGGGYNTIKLARTSLP